MFIEKSRIDMDATLFSGQAFRWDRVEGGFVGCTLDNPAIIKELDNGYEIISLKDDAFWENYFDLDRDYSLIAKRHEDDEKVKNAFECCPGLRVMNQPVWECVCGFIISANNNIERIRGIMRRLGENLGEPMTLDGKLFYSLPTPEALVKCGTDGLYKLGLGYRAPYLYETSKMVMDGFDLQGLKDMGYDAALKELLKLKGVGEKVADCILLFSCGYDNAFPVDVWVKRVMGSLYGVEGTTKVVKKSAFELFGNDAGIVQQALFHSARLKMIEV
ncbi:MAG: DNA-3-methyladenine glycosylase 2 family protein [Clostridiales bacterium]|nr:DNA-3-methyladenine glycosylase 2 family protein [Clostridiales bacterium]